MFSKVVCVEPVHFEPPGYKEYLDMLGHIGSNVPTW